MNLYGATKLCAEKLFVQGNAYAAQRRRRFAACATATSSAAAAAWSRSSCAASRRGALTVTDERMTRFWITLDQAVDFVLSPSSRCEGGEVFVPKIPRCV